MKLFHLLLYISVIFSSLVSVFSQSYSEIEKESFKFLAEAGLSDFGGLSTINLVADSWKVITHLFKTCKWNIIKDKIPGQGFQSIISKSVSDSIVGLEINYLDEYLNYFAKIIELPDDQNLRNSIYNSIKYTKYSKQKLFSGLNFSFSKQSGGSSYYVTFFHRKNLAEGTIDILYSYFKFDFILAPDVLIMNKGLSVLGGVFAHEKDYLIYQKRSLTDDDIQGILAFGQMINMKSIYAHLGVSDLSLPD